MVISPSAPTSPRTPDRRRRSMRVPSIQSDHESFSPIAYPGINTGAIAHSRKSSQSSYLQFSPITPRRPSSRSKRPSSSRLSIGSNISAGLTSNPSASGFGNLADELEEAWDSDIDDPDSVFLEGLQEGDRGSVMHSPGSMRSGSHRFSNGATPRSPIRTRGLLDIPDKPPSPSKQWASMGTHQQTESLYDGSDYGRSSDDEAFDKIAPSLQRKLHDLEEVTRITSNADALSELGGVIPRTTNALRSHLGDQATVEHTVTRLATAYTSLSSHRIHQSREVLIASHRALSPAGLTGIFDLPPETIDLIIEEADALITTLPFLSAPPILNSSIDSSRNNPLASLQSFAHTTYDLLTTLHALTDTLIEHRQHLLTATRRLKSVRELVDDLRLEEELMETSIMLIQAGDWDRRCRERHAAKAVGELLEGFKAGWDVEYSEDAWRPDRVNGVGRKATVR